MPSPSSPIPALRLHESRTAIDVPHGGGVAGEAAAGTLCRSRRRAAELRSRCGPRDVPIPHAHGRAAPADDPVTAPPDLHARDGQTRRILIVITAQLGDVLLCAPLAAAARARWPGATVDVLGFKGSLALLAGNPDVAACIEVDKRAGLAAQLRQAWRLRRHYDLAFVTRGGDRAHVYGIVMARRRSALVPVAGPGSRWKRWTAQHTLPVFPRRHQVLEKLHLLDPWGVPAGPIAVQPPAGAALPQAVEEALRHPCVVVQVPSMWRYKRWPAAHYRALVEALVADGVQVLLTGSGAPEDRAQVDEVLHGLAPAGDAVLDLAGRLSLAQVRALLGRCDAYVGPDTSVTHLAAAVGAPVVSFYGPTDPQDFGPWPNGHEATQPWQARGPRQQVGRIVVLQGPDLPGRQCVPCRAMGCENHRDSASHCLDHLAPERVLEDVRRHLAAGNRHLITADSVRTRK